MKIISFDVGIKNLAYCIFSIGENNTFQIADWQVISLMEKEEPSVYCNCSAVKQVAIKKTPRKKMENFFTIVNGENPPILPVDPPKLCCRVAKFKKGHQTFCEKHSKTQTEWRIPETRFKSIKNINLENMVALATELGIMDIPKKKADVLNILQSHLQKICLEPVIEKQTKSALDTNLVLIGKNMKTLLNAVLENHKDITHVLIENQISPLANRMKTVQGMLSQYFIMMYDAIEIEFISSANKLKMFSKTKVREQPGTQSQSQIYKSHKKDGVYYCEKVLEKNPWLSSSQWIETDKKKKDDLADCFLQGLWYLKKENMVGDRFVLE
jgi:hypothetical protein